MFDELFDNARSLFRHRSGQFASDRAQYLANLADKGYSRDTLIYVGEHLLVAV